MATKSKTLKYGGLAVVLALVIIGTTLYVNPMTANAQTNFVVMLTDPPKVPDGTTSLNVTYTKLQLYVTDSSGKSAWVDTSVTGTINLLSLVSVSQTIASISLPTGSTIDKLQFTITSAQAKINGKTVTADILSPTLIVNLAKVKLSGTTTGALIDLRPTLLEIKAVDDTGAPISYYVLVPSATAILRTSVDETSKSVGGKHKLTDDDNKNLNDEYAKASGDVSITAATIKVTGDSTAISVTLKNAGATDVTIHGLTVSGDFGFSMASGGQGNGGRQGNPKNVDHPRDVPFEVSGNALVPRMGGDNGDGKGNAGLVLKAGDTETVSFSGVIKMNNNGRGASSSMTITAIAKNVYTIRVSGEGSQALDVTAS